MIPPEFISSSLELRFHEFDHLLEYTVFSSEVLGKMDQILVSFTPFFIPLSDNTMLNFDISLPIVNGAFNQNLPCSSGVPGAFLTNVNVILRLLKDLKISMSATSGVISELRKKIHNCINHEKELLDQLPKMVLRQKDIYVEAISEFLKVRSKYDQKYQKMVGRAKKIQKSPDSKFAKKHIERYVAVLDDYRNGVEKMNKEYKGMLGVMTMACDQMAKCQYQMMDGVSKLIREFLTKCQSEFSGFDREKADQFSDKNHFEEFISNIDFSRTCPLFEPFKDYSFRYPDLSFVVPLPLKQPISSDIPLMAVIARTDFTAESENELSFKKGDILFSYDYLNNFWIFCENRKNKAYGFAPSFLVSKADTNSMLAVQPRVAIEQDDLATSAGEFLMKLETIQGHFKCMRYDGHVGKIKLFAEEFDLRQEMNDRKMLSALSESPPESL